MKYGILKYGYEIWPTKAEREECTERCIQIFALARRNHSNYGDTSNHVSLDQITIAGKLKITTK